MSRCYNPLVLAFTMRGDRRCGGGMARFGDLEAAIMDVMWAAGEPLRVREVADELNRTRPLAFNTVQTVMENLFRKDWLDRQKSGRAYFYVAARSREDYVAGLMGEALAVARDPAATLVRLVEDLEPAEIAQLRMALDAAAERESPR
jgi:predicted transcriptional regulator